MSVELRSLPHGPFSSYQVIGEVTEAIHARLLEAWDGDRPRPRLEEDLSFVPKDREEVVYVYMYRLAQNPALQNRKRLRQAPVEFEEDGVRRVFYHRPPLLMDLFYLVAVHAKFRSDAERLLGWALLTLHDTGRLIYRRRRFALPDGRVVDSLGRPWQDGEPAEDEGVFVEKVSLAMVDDLTVGDAIAIYTLHEAPYRPFLTYRARVVLDGPLVSAGEGTRIKFDEPGGLRQVPRPGATGRRPPPVSRPPAEDDPRVPGPRPYVNLSRPLPGKKGGKPEPEE